MVQRLDGDMVSMRQRREAEVVSALADYPSELIRVKAYPYTEPTPDDATVVKSVFVDLSSRPGFALPALMHRDRRAGRDRMATQTVELGSYPDRLDLFVGDIPVATLPDPRREGQRGAPATTRKRWSSSSAI